MDMHSVQQCCRPELVCNRQALLLAPAGFVPGGEVVTFPVLHSFKRYICVTASASATQDQQHAAAGARSIALSRACMSYCCVDGVVALPVVMKWAPVIYSVSSAQLRWWLPTAIYKIAQWGNVIK